MNRVPPSERIGESIAKLLSQGLEGDGSVASTPPSATSPQTSSSAAGSKPLCETNPTLPSHYVQLSTKPAKLQLLSNVLGDVRGRMRGSRLVQTLLEDRRQDG